MKEIGERVNRNRFTVVKNTTARDYDRKWLVLDNAKNWIVYGTRTRQLAQQRAAILNKQNGGIGYTLL